MKTHAIIPVFIPHLGCSHNCIFCNQKAITAKETAPSAEETERLIMTHLETIRRSPTIRSVEIAFFGGSFTGIDPNEQEMYLRIAKRHKDAGDVGRIRLSTRPDYIDEEVLERLHRFGVNVVELGAQSFDDEVLRRSGRGHSRAEIVRAARMIRERGFSLGIQLMVGLPGDSYEKSVSSAVEAVSLLPECVRIYPTVVLKDTPLYELYLQGGYRPLDEAEAVGTVKKMLQVFYEAQVDVIRVGLKSSDNITMDSATGAVGAGTYHPAFRQLVESSLAREILENIMRRRLKLPKVRNEEMECKKVWEPQTERKKMRTAGSAGIEETEQRRRETSEQLMERKETRLVGVSVRTEKTQQSQRKTWESQTGHKKMRTTGAGVPLYTPDGRLMRGARPKVTFFSAPESFSDMIGFGSSNKIYFSEKYPELSFRFAVDPELKRGKYRMDVEDVESGRKI